MSGGSLTGGDCFIVTANKDCEAFKHGDYQAVPKDITINGTTLPTDIYDVTDLRKPSAYAYQANGTQRRAQEEFLHTLVTADRGHTVGTVNSRFGRFAISNHHVMPRTNVTTHYAVKTAQSIKWSRLGIVKASTRLHGDALLSWWPWLRAIWPFLNRPNDNQLDLAIVEVTHNSTLERLPDIAPNARKAVVGETVRFQTWQTNALGIVIADGIDVPIYISDTERVMMRDQVLIHWPNQRSIAGDSGGMIFAVSDDAAVCLHAWGDSNGQAGGQDAAEVVAAIRGLI